MVCFFCHVETRKEDSAEIYSLESCMCKTCHVKFQLWSIAQGVDPSTGENFPDRKETVN